MPLTLDNYRAAMRELRSLRHFANQEARRAASKDGLDIPFDERADTILRSLIVVPTETEAVLREFCEHYPSCAPMVIEALEFREAMLERMEMDR